MALRRSKRIAEAFRAGSPVEVQLHSDGGWYEVIVKTVLPQGRGIQVLYSNIFNASITQQMQEPLPLANVRPRGEAPGKNTFYIDDLVECHRLGSDGGWWPGVVTDCHGNPPSAYTVVFPGCREESICPESEVRRYFDWRERQWQPASQERSAFVARQKVEISFITDNFGFVWSPGTVIKVICNTTYTVECTRPTSLLPTKHIVCVQHMRPVPPPADEDESFVEGEHIEVLHQGCWTQGFFSRVCEDDISMHTVKLINEEAEFFCKDIRKNLKWMHNRWRRNSKIKASKPSSLKVLTLWDNRNGRPIKTHTELQPIMLEAGFETSSFTRVHGTGRKTHPPLAPAFPSPGTAWQAYASSEQNHTERSGEFLRLPYPLIEGAYPLVYVKFLQDMNDWMQDPQHPYTLYFSIRSVDLTREVEMATPMQPEDDTEGCSTSPPPSWKWEQAGRYGLFPCTWNWVEGFVYRLITFDDLTVQGVMLEDHLEYWTDRNLNLDNRYAALELKHLHIQDVDNQLVPAYDFQVDSPNVVTLLDQESGRALTTHFELEGIMNSLGFLAEKRTEEEGKSYLTSSEPQSCTWMSYSFGNPEADMKKPRLPYPTFEGAHPMVFVAFLLDLSSCIGHEMTSKYLIIEEEQLTRRIEILAHWSAGWDVDFRGLLPCSWKGMSNLFFRQVTLDAQSKARGLTGEIEEYFIHQVMEDVSEEEIVEFLADLRG